MNPPDGTIHPTLDLAAAPARADEVGPEMPLPPAEIADLLGTLEKAIRSQRLYQPNNPVYRSFITATQAAFTRLWDRVSSLTVGIEEGSFKWYGRTFNVGEGRDSLPFMFYKDGIRFVTFLPGFQDEAERFLGVVNSARTHDQTGNDDMVTLLWQQEFTCFQYSYVDALAEGLQVPQSTVPKLAGFELTLVMDDIAGKERPDAPPRSVPPSVEAGQPTVAGLVNRDDFEETLYFLDSTELARLTAEVEQEWARDVKTDVLDALFDRLEEGLPEWRTEIMRILRQLLPVYMGAGDLSSATRILKELNSLIDRGELQGEHRDEAVELFRELSEPVVLTQLMRSLEDGSIDPASADLNVFLKHLGPAAMPVLLAAIERTEVAALQDKLRIAIEGLAADNRDRLVDLLSNDDPDILRGAARLAGQLALVNAAAPLGELLKRSEVAVRRAAVEALIRIHNSTALDALQRALEDQDREVRINAVRGLGTLRYAPARQRLEELLDSRMVRDADLTEKIAFYEAYGAVGNADSVGTLDKILNGKKLFQKETPETRACAAMALGKLGSPAARASLQRATSETNAIVRNAVMKALRQESA